MSAVVLAALLLAQSTATLRVGATAVDCCAAAYYAQDAGFFQKAGLNVTLTTLNNGASVAAGVASGTMDVGISTPMQIAQAVSRGLPLTIIAPGSLLIARTPTQYLCVAAGSPIAKPKDLEGKTIAVSALRTLSDTTTKVWMTKAGADTSKLRFVEMPVSEMAAALERGTVDAAVLTEPSFSVAKSTYHIKTLGNPAAAIAPRYLTSAWFTTADFAQAHPDLVKRFASAIYDAGTWANAHHDQSAVILGKYAKVDSATLARMTRVVYADALRAEDIQPELDAAYSVGALSRPMNASALITR
ncbi:MAG TPA: ABC transporter substrate-binding protein [Candidatus Binatia bacterium]|nr:ABC transporter substrate-binding protein [Candidatus Binatia bacterium]